MRRVALTTLVLGTVLQAAAQIADPAQAAAIIAQLEDAPTSAARFNLLNGRDFVFDFNAGIGVAGGAGGNITVASLADFPFLVGKGMSLTVGKMAPCGLSTPHYHPRATEFLYMLSGSLKAGFILENGARLVTNILYPGQGTIFPKGSFHFLANLDCQPVSYVAGLNSVDPGAATVAQRFFGIPPTVLDATLGDIGVDEVVRIAQSIPDTFALGVQSCLDKCKIPRGDQPKDQQQPRIGGNEYTSTGTSQGGEQQPPSNPSSGGNLGGNHHRPPPDGGSGNDGDDDEWDDDGEWDEGGFDDDNDDDNDNDGDDGDDYGNDDEDDQDTDDSDWGDENDNKSGGSSPPSHGNWWEEKDGDSGVKKHPGHKHRPNRKGGNDNVRSGAPRGSRFTSPRTSSRYHLRKRSDIAEDPVTFTSAISSLISSTTAQTLEELTFFLKLVLCVLLFGYAFILAYFVVPAWRNRRLQARLRACATISPPAPVQDVKT